MELFKVFGSIGIKNKEANRAIDETVDKAESSGGKIKDAFQKVATFLGTLFAGKAIFDFGKSVVEAAATAKAVQSQFDQVFQGIEGIATERLDGIAKKVGVLPNRMKPSFNQIASFAKVAGMETGQALDFTARATEAAADSAAFYDKSLEETTETLKSYLKGNFEVADNLGILSTETTRNAKATELFGQKYKDLDGIQQQEVLLRMFEDANKVSGAMGQASREADGFENVMGNLKQAWEDFKVVIGGPLLAPVVQGLQGAVQWMQSAQEWVGQLYAKLQENGAIESFKGAFENVKTTIDVIIGSIGDFVANLLGIDQNASSVDTVAQAFEKVADFVEDATGGIKDFANWFKEGGLGVDALKAAVVGLTGAWTGYKIVTGVLKGIETARNALFLISFARTQAQAVANGTLTASLAAQNTAAVGASGAFSLFNTVLSLNPIVLVVGALAALTAGLIWFFTQTETGKKMWADFMEWAKGAWESIKEFFVNLWQSISEGAVNLWNGVVEAWNGAVEGVQNLWNGIVEFFSNLWTSIQTTASTAWDMVVQAIMTVVQPFIDTFTQYWTAMSDGLSQMWEGIKMVFQGAWEFIKAIFMGAVLIIIDLVTGNFTQLGADLSLIWESIKSAISLVWEGIKTYFSGVIDAIVTFATTSFENFKTVLSVVWEGIKSAASTAWEWIKTTVSNLIDGLVQGAQNTWENFKNFLANLWEGIKSTATSAWEGLKNSVQNTIDNMIAGAKRAWEDLKQSVSNLVSNVKGIFDGLRNIDLFGAGRAILDGFLGGLRSAWSGVTNFVGGIADWIRKNKGPIEYDRKLLIPAGNAIMEGLGGGLEDGFGDVQDNVLGMAGKLVQKVSSAAKTFKNKMVPDICQ